MTSFGIYKDGLSLGIVRGEIEDLHRKMETDWTPGKGMYIDFRPDEDMPLGFTLSDGRKVIRIGDFARYLLTEKAILEEIENFKKRDEQEIFTVLVEMKIRAKSYDDVDQVVERIVGPNTDYYVKWRHREDL